MTHALIGIPSAWEKIRTFIKIHQRGANTFCGGVNICKWIKFQKQHCVSLCRFFAMPISLIVLKYIITPRYPPNTRNVLLPQLRLNVNTQAPGPHSRQGRLLFLE